MLICDLAETYGVLEYRMLPVSLLATLCVGLRDDSRIKLRMSGVRASAEISLLAAAVDKLAMLVWMQSRDGQKGKNKPKSVFNMIAGIKREQEIQVFETAIEFEAARAKILEGHHGD